MARYKLIPTLILAALGAACTPSSNEPEEWALRSGQPDALGAATAQEMPPMVVLLTEGARIPLGGRLGRAKVVDWRTSDPTIATVDRTGQLRPIRQGTVSVTASANRLIEVTHVRVTSMSRIEILAPKLSILVGEEVALRARAVSTSADTLPLRNASWVSMSTSVATIRADGTVTGVANGTSRIQVSSGGSIAELTLTVSGTSSAPEVPRVTFFQIAPRVSVVSQGASVQFTPTLVWSDGVTRQSAVTYTASGGSVSASGLYIASQAIGTFYVVASCACGKVDTAVVTTTSGVLPPPAPSTVALPRVYLDGMLAEARTAPVLRTINAQNGAELQRAIDTARFGDQILLQPGVTYTGVFVLKRKTGSGWITIRSAAPDAQLPAPGTRIRPSNAALLPKLASSIPDINAIETESGAHGYRLLAVEVIPPANSSYGYTLINLGKGAAEQNTIASIPYNLVLDRVYVHGSPQYTFQRCIALNSASTAIVDSWIGECHHTENDSQAILGWNGPGPYKIVNNYLEGAGENVMFGSGDPGIANQLPADIEIRRNHFYKPPSWRGVWRVKNSFELKAGLRVLVEGNIFENNWIDGQDGFAILLKSVNAQNSAPWSQTADVTFRLNIVRNSSSGVNIAGKPEPYPAIPAARILLRDNVFERIGTGDYPGGRLWQVSKTDDLTFERNTGFGRTHGLILLSSPMNNLLLRDNIFGTTQTNFDIWDFAISSGEGFGFGSDALTRHTGSWRLENNVIPGVSASKFPNSLIAPSFQAIGLAGWPTDLSLSPNSPFARSSSTGGMPGADVASVIQATQGVVVPR